MDNLSLATLILYVILIFEALYLLNNCHPYNAFAPIAYDFRAILKARHKNRCNKRRL